ncbi:1-(5-phosphoribosyl)-5-[(5-phosphoribosylamino)methylideneamino]imidazole-4-carboxamide isomerase [Ichthyenterobacterium sp. W332]|uniref:1-(5-phosphoribosyl)-5-[(5-phosphoribosylamino)methylideneamino] imidazole-4-carboxamide isomerase n=1 Tax=Microcosmobacter mediterraneus TaxID=3075607 RepID=A0ABU2YNQ7_9FLAO|nr:1-(5-phosphoribosyl)-5-[(5-phosphoribosylamino)methylideneamino]imidazole-4-carboxamide isomerase [Ichthyenterobacterium sp. W332]MDT0558688.1 1-(5-phosphoribosyl)-5-[(5-phosphoribosylamino)methylideneamino]imidazole-4-carboxamide isomerase [Ichthyenterobacterium sp. W332]
MRIIPAIDIIGGKCVRLTKGDYNTKKVYNENPLEVAKAFEASGIGYLHLVDLDGAKARHIVNYKVLELIASKTNLKIDFGGGLKANEDLNIAFNCGAKQITGGSIAVSDRQTFEGWLAKYGPQKIILGADSNHGKIAINGWQDSSKEEVVSFIKDYQRKQIKYVICTDISKDGMLEGPSIALYKTIIKECSNNSSAQSIKLIASGGVSGIKDLEELEKIGCEGVIIGKAIYENRISLRELEQFI